MGKQPSPSESEQAPALVERETGQPGRGEPQHHAERCDPPGAGLGADGGQGGDAGSVEQGEEHEAQSLQGREMVAQGGGQVAPAVDHRQGADDDLLGHEAREQGHHLLPGDAQGSKEGRQGLSDLSRQALGAAGHGGSGQVGEQPHEDHPGHDEGGGAVEEVLELLAGAQCDGTQGGQAVGRHLHDEGFRPATHAQPVERQPHEQDNEEASGVEGDQDPRRHGRGEEDAGEEDEHLQPGAAQGKGDQQHGEQAVVAAGEDAGAHHRGHVAAVAQQQADEGLAIQSHAVHQPVHEEGGARQVAAVLQQRHEQEEERDDGEEGEHHAHSLPQAAMQETLRQARRFRRGEEAFAPPLEQVVQQGLQWRTQAVDELEQPDRCPPWRAKRRRVVPGSREATRDTRRAEGAKGDPKGASERGVQSYGRPVCSRNELAMLWRNAG